MRRLALEVRLLENTAQALQSRINFVNAALTELRLARMSLEGLEKEKEGSELLVHIGGGSYIKTRLETPNVIITGVGADVSIEKTLPQALENIKGRIEELEKTSNSLSKQLDQVLSRIAEGRSKLQSMVEEISSKQRGKIV
ncbi:MAG: prefoldin subunit alpha [Candidatus Bathyarchaeia archaeon]